MSKEKTEYRFSVHAAPAVINQVIQNYLAANQYVQIPKPNANYYFFNDPWMKGKRSIEYYIHGTEVIVLAYMGTFEKPRGLEGFVGAIPKKSFRDDLEPLFIELHRIDMMSLAPQQGMPMQQGAPIQQGAPMQQGAPIQQGMPPQQGYIPPQNSANQFVEKSRKTRENWTIAGFVIGLVGLLLSFFGIAYGAIIIVLEFWCGFQGLQTKKKGLAIATIVLAGISVLFLILSIVYTASHPVRSYRYY